MKGRRVEFYLDDVAFYALKARASDEDRSVSQHICHLVRQDIRQASQHDEQDASRDTGGKEGEGERER